ncbi:MAG: VanW family protein [Anaerotignaceae bacterium]
MAKKKTGIAIGVIAIGVIVCLLVVVGGIFGYIKYQEAQNLKVMEDYLSVDTIFEGISVNGENIGGLTKTEALAQLESGLNEPLKTKNIKIVHIEANWTLTYDEMECKYDLSSVVDEAFLIGRSKDNIKENFEEAIEAQKGIDLTTELVYNESIIDEFLNDIKESVDIEAIDAKLSKTNGNFFVVDEVNGFTVDTTQAKADILNLVATTSDGTISLAGTETKATITKDMYEKSTTLIGTYSTKYTGSETLGRNINLSVGSQKITETIVQPGGVFSMNEELGPQTYAEGFRDAAVIVNGKLEDGLAGGVCQITSTLYNAVVKAELEIVSRRNHSLVVGYVPLGQDAAIAGDYLDFKFKNSTDYPIYIEAYTQNGTLTTNIYGYEEHNSTRKVELETVFVTTIQKPAEIVTKDPTLPEGERVVTYTGKTGQKVSTYKKVYENGQLLSREWFNDSTYRATADEVRVGTGEKVAEETTTTNTTTNTTTTTPTIEQPTVEQPTIEQPTVEPFTSEPTTNEPPVGGLIFE